MSHRRVKQGPNPDTAVNSLRTVMVDKVPLLIRPSANMPKGYDARAVARYGRARAEPAWRKLHIFINGHKGSSPGKQRYGAKIQVSGSRLSTRSTG